MKALMAEVPSDLVETRRRIGADRWDEIWDGVLHMPPCRIEIIRIWSTRSKIGCG